MNLVDYINSAFQHRWGVHYRFSYVSDIIDTRIGRGVHFQYVRGGSLVDGAARLTLSAGTSVYGGETVDCLGKQLGAGGLTRSP